MPILRIPTPLRVYTNGQSEVTINGSNISEALTDLTTQYPAIEPHLFNEGGELRPFVNIFVGENNIKDLQGVSTAIRDGEKLMLIPSIAGGCHCVGIALSGGRSPNTKRTRSNPRWRGDCFVGLVSMRPSQQPLRATQPAPLRNDGKDRM